MELADSFLKHFSDMEDFRIQNHNFRHKLKDIFIIAILGTICGADGWLEIERFGQRKKMVENTRPKVSCEGIPLGNSRSF